MLSKAFHKSINTASPYPFLSKDFNACWELYPFLYPHRWGGGNFKYSLQVDAAAIFEIFLKHLVKSCQYYLVVKLKSILKGIFWESNFQIYLLREQFLINTLGN